ncbi:MAG: hypothetical protein AB7D00_00580 [Rhodospirillaceae bacterium]
MTTVLLTHLAVQAAAVVLSLGIAGLDAVALALWRRWLGGMGGNFPRSLKVAALCSFIGGQYVAAAWPWLFPRAWAIDAALPWAYFAAALAWAALPAGLVGLCVWFVNDHDNGGPQGSGGPARYGWAGYGYPIAWTLRGGIPEVRLGALVVVQAGAWTEVGELWLGGVTGLFLGGALGIGIAAHIIPLVIS